MGMVWRFGAAGKFASGDDLAEGVIADPLLQSESANFMRIYYLIAWSLIGSAFGCACIGYLFICICAASYKVEPPIPQDSLF